MPTTSSRSPTGTRSTSPREGGSYSGALATRSRSVVTERVTGRQEKKSESGEYLVPGLIQDTAPATLTQLTARGLHN